MTLPGVTPVMNLSVADVYDVLREIGRGVYGTVFLGEHRETRQLRALKKFRSEQGAAARVLKEKAILRCVKPKQDKCDDASQYLIQVYEIIEDPEGCVWLSTEYLAHGNLLTWFRKARQVSELQVCIIIHQVLQALHYLHENHILHRDIKPDNILVRSTVPLTIALCDFGISKLCASENGAFTPAGPGLDFMAPRILEHIAEGQKGSIIAFQCEAKGWDVWSVGVLTYWLLSGKMPFKASTVRGMLDVHDNLRFPESDFGGVSSEAKSFVRSLLSVDTGATSRVTAAKVALQHSWFNIVQTPGDAQQCASAVLVGTPTALASVTDDDIRSQWAEPPSANPVETAQRPMVPHVVSTTEKKEFTFDNSAIAAKQAEYRAKHARKEAKESNEF